MTDDLSPSGSEHIHDKELPNGWTRVTYSDCVVWRWYGNDYYQVARWPFVPGYFLSNVCEDDYGICDVPVNPHPFRSLQGAMAAALALGPQDDANTNE
jgi:hypothetical protein